MKKFFVLFAALAFFAGMTLTAKAADPAPAVNAVAPVAPETGAAAPDDKKADNDSKSKSKSTKPHKHHKKAGKKTGAKKTHKKKGDKDKDKTKDEAANGADSKVSAKD